LKDITIHLAAVSQLYILVANENARLFRSLPGFFHHFHSLPVCPAGKTNIRAVLKNRAKAKLFRIETQNPITPVGRPSISALLKNRVFSFAARIYWRHLKMPEVSRREDKYTPRKIGQSRSGFSTKSGIFKCGVYIS